MSVHDGYYNYPNVAAQIYPNYESAVLDGLRGLGLSEDSALVVSLHERIAKLEAMRTSLRPLMLATVLLGLGGILIGTAALMRRG